MLLGRTIPRGGISAFRGQILPRQGSSTFTCPKEQCKPYKATQRSKIKYISQHHLCHLYFNSKGKNTLSKQDCLKYHV